jgi:hypothetical protein
MGVYEANLEVRLHNKWEGPVGFVVDDGDYAGSSTDIDTINESIGHVDFGKYYEEHKDDPIPFIEESAPMGKAEWDQLAGYFLKKPEEESDVFCTPLEDFKKSAKTPRSKRGKKAYILVEGPWANLMIGKSARYATTMQGDWRRRIEEFAESIGYKIEGPIRYGPSNE